MALKIGSAVSRGAGFPVRAPKDKFGGTIGNETASRTIRIEYTPNDSSWFANVPAYGTVHPGADWLVFDNYTLDQIGFGLADLVLNYKQSGWSAQYPAPGLPDDEVTEDMATERVDIIRHPDFTVAVTAWGSLSMFDFYDWGAGRIFHGAELPATWVDASGKEVPCPNAGEAVPEEIRGQDSYYTGTGTVTVVEWSYNEPANPIPLGGKKAKPTGYDGTDDYWLLLSGSRRRQGAFWQRVLVYQYSAKAISDVVYDTATP